VVGLAQFLKVPPKGYVPGGAPAAKKPGAAVPREDFRPMEMLATPQFYICWILFAIGAGAGLMIISQLAAIMADQAGLKAFGFWLVMSCGVGNGAGRILAGMISDKVGRQRTLQGFFLIQAVVMILFSIALPEKPMGSLPAMLVLSAFVGANYGANLSLFPSITKDFYGLKNFGVNYGLVFTAWGFGGFLLSLAASKLYESKLLDHHFTYNYYGAAALLVLAALAAFVLKPPRAVGEKSGG
jgi:OFA family oxalate/formate antiporter-like MFS transporter